MRCEDVRRALPLATTEEAAEVRLHTASCAECDELLQAYDADEAALSALRGAPRAMPPAMDGFADAVMAAVAKTPRQKAPEAVVLRPQFGGAWVALAAAVLLFVGLGIVLSGDRAQNGFETPTAKGVAPTPEVAPTPVAVGTPEETLPAPKRTRRARAPMPRLQPRARRGIVPVEGGRKPQLPRGPLFDMIRDFQREFPNWSPNGLDRRVPPLRPGEREVRF